MTDMDNGPKTIAVAMSGGVDSSTAAALLHEQGHSLVGLTMQLWNQRRLPALHPDGPVQHRCCSIDDVYDARRVAEHLGIPHYVVNFEARFEEDVVRPFVASYLAGETPIPCTLCNNYIKFDQLLVTTRQIGAELIATGHYARVRRNPATGRHELLCARDRTKDQSYFLFGLTQEQLGATLFPLGDLAKEEVRELARARRLPVAEKGESQEICFVPTGEYVRFIEAYRAEQGAPSNGVEGEILTREGKLLGEHEGIHHYTVGQRRGLGVATGKPLYVVAIDAARKQVVVGEVQSLYSRRLVAKDMNWIAAGGEKVPLRLEVKIRNKHVAAAATVFPESGGTAIVEFDAPQRAITRGQAAVFYSGDVVVGGGWIA